MNRLQTELHRLYFPTREDKDTTAPTTNDAPEAVRGMVMELSQPADWELLSKVWNGVQAELNLPAPAIAVSGSDALQLWFSFEHPISVNSARAFLESVRVRFLPEVDTTRIHLMPAPDASALDAEVRAKAVPAQQEPSGNWSAFVAPDLAAVFADTPWLDMAPSEEGQASLLRGLAVIEQTAYQAALKRLGPAVRASRMPLDPTRHTSELSPIVQKDPKRFLLQIMNDDSVSLALRIEAAKALLPYVVEAAA